MILNILLIIILLVVFFRLMNLSYYIETYTNPFIYDLNPIINKDKLTYTPPPYLQANDSPSLIQLNSNSQFIDKNNELIIDYLDDSNYIIDDPSFTPVRLIYPTNKQLKGSSNKCLDYDGDLILMNSCDNINRQKWTMLNDQLINTYNNKCLSYDSNNNGIIEDCSNNSIKQQWIPDTTNRIHNINNYNNCLEINDSYVFINDCSYNENQVWTLGE